MLDEFATALAVDAGTREHATDVVSVAPGQVLPKDIGLFALSIAIGSPGALRASRA